LKFANRIDHLKMLCYLTAMENDKTSTPNLFPSIIEGLDILSQSLFIGFHELNSLVDGCRLGAGSGGGMFVSFAIRP
jgi:hypothetical protein